MSKEKQIEEMARFVCSSFHGHHDCENCSLYEERCCVSFCAAKRLYNAGYRKQSEGEWVPCDVLPADEDGEWTSYACSMCKHTTDSYYRDVHDLSRYCPNCGARMGGGE